MDTRVLQALACDSTVAWDFMRFMRDIGESGQQLVHRIARLVMFAQADGQRTWPIPLMEMVMTSLQLLELVGKSNALLLIHLCLEQLTSRTSVTRTIILQDIPQPSPVNGLFPAPFTALTCIWIRLITDLRQPNIEIRLPYAYGWSTVLRECPQLAAFQIGNTFQGCLDVHPLSFCAQWGSLFRELADPGVCPELKLLLIRIEGRALSVGTVKAMEKNARDAEAFVGKLKVLVPALRSPQSFKVRQENGLEVHFNLETSFGERMGYPS